jgi:hypothetical protein
MARDALEHDAILAEEELGARGVAHLRAPGEHEIVVQPRGDLRRDAGAGRGTDPKVVLVQREGVPSLPASSAMYASPSSMSAAAWFSMTMRGLPVSGAPKLSVAGSARADGDEAASGDDATPFGNGRSCRSEEEAQAEKMTNATTGRAPRVMSLEDRGRRGACALKRRREAEP